MSKRQRRFLPPGTARSPLSNAKRERRMWIIVLVVTGLAVGLALGALGYSYLAERVFPLSDAVARVSLDDGQSLAITRGEFYTRVRFERARYAALARQDTEAAAQLADVRGFGQMTLERMMREALVRQEAARRGLSVSEAEITQYIEEAYGLVRVTPTPTVDPLGAAGPAWGATPVATSNLAATEAAYLKRYRADLKTWAGYGVGEAAFREIVRTVLLEARLREAMGQDAFQIWLDSLPTLMTWLNGWDKDIPEKPAWP